MNLKKNIYWNTVGVTLNSFTSLFFLIIINRINGINVGGVFSYAYSLACLFFIVGVYATRTYQISDTEKKLNDSEYLISKILCCILMMLCCLLFVCFIDDTVKSYVIFIFTFFKMIEAFSDTLYGYMQKNDKLYLSGISLTIKAIISIFSFLITDFLTRSIVTSGIVMSVFSLLITLFFDVKNAKRCVEREKINIRNVLMLFINGFPIFIISFLGVYIVNAQKYAMNGVLSDSAQTVFGIIIMPATVISLCGQYIMNPMMTDLIDSFNASKISEFKRKIHLIIKLLFAFWCLCELLAYFLGIPVLNILYAIDISKYRASLLLIILGAVFYAVSIVFQNSLIIMHKNKLQIVIYSISSIFTLIISSFLIEKYGIQGASISYTVTMMLHCIMYFIYFKYETRYKKEILL